MARCGPHLAARYPGLECSAARVEAIDAGIMNYVYRVEVPGRVFYLKQALPQLRRPEGVGADLAGVSPARIEVERRALDLLAAALPEAMRDRVPRVAWYDATSNILWTEEAARGAPSLQGELAAGRSSRAAAAGVGRLIGAVHAARAGCVPPLWPADGADEANWERFLRMRTTGVLARAGLPAEAEGRVRSLAGAGRARARRGMLSHLDAAPKNVLLPDEGGPVLLDFELGAAVSDPAYDPGFMAGHYLLLGENRPAMREDALAAVDALLAGYRETAPPVDGGWENRCRSYAALAMLYRLYGSSPAPYLSRERFPAIRARALAILREECPVG